MSTRTYQLDLLILLFLDKIATVYCLYCIQAERGDFAILSSKLSFDYFLKLSFLFILFGPMLFNQIVCSWRSTMEMLVRSSVNLLIIFPTRLPRYWESRAWKNQKVLFHLLYCLLICILALRKVAIILEVIVAEKSIGT